MSKQIISQRTSSFNEVQARVAEFYALPVDRAVVYLRTKDRKTFSDIGEIFGKSKAWASQTYQRAVRRGVTA